MNEKVIINFTGEVKVNSIDILKAAISYYNSNGIIDIDLAIDS